MRKRDRRRKALPWALIWLIQLIAMLLVGSVVALSLWLGGFVHALLVWGLMPISGFFAACIATRAGLNNYLAWLAPPAMLFCGNLLAWGYPPSAGPVFLCAFISLAGAAAGEVIKRQNKDKGAQ